MNTRHATVAFVCAGVLAALAGCEAGQGNQLAHRAGNSPDAMSQPGSRDQSPAIARTPEDQPAESATSERVERTEVTGDETVRPDRQDSEQAEGRSRRGDDEPADRPDEPAQTDDPPADDPEPTDTGDDADPMDQEPILDTDEDGVPDVDDLCPEVFDPAQNDLDGDGLGDACDLDVDGDGSPCDPDDVCEDCAPLDPAIHPDAEEICDGVDNDCQDGIDNGFDDLDGDGIKDCIDDDIDGDGDPNALDCAPTNGAISTSALEVCDAVDNNCDSQVDEVFDGQGKSCDGDDPDSCSDGELVCVNGEVLCNDPGSFNLEICNGLDDDCDGETDEGLTSGVIPCDGDDTDLCKGGTLSCVDGVTACSDDAESAVEVCNGVDDDCDGTNEDVVPELESA